MLLIKLTRITIPLLSYGTMNRDIQILSSVLLALTFVQLTLATPLELLRRHTDVSHCHVKRTNGTLCYLLTILLPTYPSDVGHLAAHGTCDNSVIQWLTQYTEYTAALR